MLKKLDLRQSSGDYLSSLPRPTVSQDLPTDSVRRIISRVRREGDAALIELTESFDKVRLEGIAVEQSELEAAYNSISPALRSVL